MRQLIQFFLLISVLCGGWALLGGLGNAWRRVWHEHDQRKLGHDYDKRWR